MGHLSILDFSVGVFAGYVGYKIGSYIINQITTPHTTRYQVLPGIRLYKLRDIMAYVGNCRRNNVPINVDFVPEYSNYYMDCS
mgnify:FL=1